MPTYDYRCPEGHTFEVFEKISDGPEHTCPDCGETATRQISGGAGVMLDGGGATLDGGSSKGEPPHAPPDLSRRG